MKKNMIILLSVATFFLPGICQAQAPHQVGGFVLGKDISGFADKVKMDTSLPIRHMEYIQEVEIGKIEGFKSGLIGYGTCTKPNPIVRIKLKYADSSKKFYEKLLKRFKAGFGEPTEWRGDPFHIVIAWKWSFTDTQKNRISLTLSHNTLDLEEKRGNAVKLTMSSLIEKQRLCFEEKHPEFRKKDKKQRRKKKARRSANWDLYIPR